MDEVLAALPSAAIVIDSDGEVIKASTAAYALGLVDGQLLLPAIAETVAGGGSSIRGRQFRH